MPDQLQLRIKLPTEGATGTALLVPAKTPAMWQFWYVGPDTSASMSAPTDLNADAVARPLSAQEFIESRGLLHVLDGTERLLVSRFGAGSRVVPHIRLDRETGSPVLIFDLLTPASPTYEEQKEFLDEYVQIPGTGPYDSPTLMWNPARAGHA